MRAQRLWSQQIDFPPEELLQVERQMHEVVERLLSRLEFNEYVDVARGVLLIPTKRAKYSKLFDAEARELALMAGKGCEQLGFRFDSHSDKYM